MATIASQIIEVCVFRWLQNEPQYLLLQRAADDDLYPNMWQIVTGTAITNENMVDAAQRELREETGLHYKRFWTVPYINSFYDRSKDAIQLIPVFAVEVDNVLKPILSKEHQKCEWLSYIVARERLIWPGHRHILKVVHKFIVSGREAAQLTEMTHL